MNSNNNEQALDLKTLLNDGKYIIPVYQRNYAWGKAEISQLIQDIDKFFKKNTDTNYYIGSLVCFKRENGDYELIDGQQRHTTISLINAFLKSKKSIEAISSTNLNFDSRKKTQHFLEELHRNFNDCLNSTGISGVQNFKDAIGFIQEEFQDIDVPKFSKDFYNKVKFFRVEVPQETDLNHYFEIMNNRGEQLEKHEIVKANLMGKIENKVEQDIFALIWDACSNMNDYVYFNFDSKIRSKLFSNRNEQANEFKDILEKENINDTDDELRLSKILSDNNLSENFSQEEKTQKEKYKSVIDFPNFLLQILKIKNNVVSLDDNKLLEQFRETEINPKEFIYDLLKYRIIFDKYIIKQDLSDADESKQNWGIRTLNDTFESTIKTFRQGTEDDEELVKLQTMLYYSNPSNTNNNWVQEILREPTFDINAYKYALSNIAKVKFDTKYLSYPEISIFNLYFIDFLLWKLYQEEIQNKKNLPESNQEYSLLELKRKISNRKDFFNSFKFKQLNSKEHLFPQAKAADFEIKHECLNGIGNLCLISTSQNSKGNKDLPSAKKKSFATDNSSLKRLIMFESFENDKWEGQQIEKHENEIKELIDKYVHQQNI